MKRPYIIPIFIPFQGCPFTCLYCQQEDITAHPNRLPSTVEIQERVLAFLKTRHPHRYSHTEVAFYGGTFTGLPTPTMISLLEAARPFLLAGQIHRLRASTKPDFITTKVLRQLNPYGLTTMELGVQSLDDEVLKRVGRGYSAKEVGRAVGMLKAAGFKVGIQLMPGLPGADRKEALQTTRETIQLKPDFVRIYPTVVLAGTPLERWWRDGRYRPWSLSEAVEICRAMKRQLFEAKIPIIKMGLQFSSDEEEGILAGPYHPRFHELVGVN